MATRTLPPSGIRRGENATGCPTTFTRRRDFLGAASFTALAGIAAVAIAKPDMQKPTSPALVQPDAALLALCGRFLQLQAALDASFAHEAERHRALKRRNASCAQLSAMEQEHEDERTAHYGEQGQLLDQIGELTASTPAGQQARARVLMGWYSLGKGHEHTVALEWHRLAPLFRDLLGEAA